MPTGMLVWMKNNILLYAETEPGLQARAGISWSTSRAPGGIHSARLGADSNHDRQLLRQLRPL